MKIFKSLMGEEATWYTEEEYKTLEKENENLRNTLQNIKREIKQHKDLGSVLFWENDMLEEINYVLENYGD